MSLCKHPATTDQAESKHKSINHFVHARIFKAAGLQEDQVQYANALKCQSFEITKCGADSQSRKQDRPEKLVNLEQCVQSGLVKEVILC